jgi:antitoxin (DNA-binding transcriptional repressor) of toxin-antitoxin stability system
VPRFHKTTTIRQLSRRTKDILEEVASTGVGFIVVRNGDALARIVPLDDNPLMVTAPDYEDVNTDRLPSEELAEPPLTDGERTLLEAIEEPMLAEIATERTQLDRDEVALHLLRLEIKGLLERKWPSNYVRTVMGERVIKSLRAGQDSLQASE